MRFEACFSELVVGLFRSVFCPGRFLIADGVLSRRFLKEIPKKFREIVSVDRNEVESRIENVVDTQYHRSSSDDDVDPSESSNGVDRFMSSEEVKLHTLRDADAAGTPHAGPHSPDDGDAWVRVVAEVAMEDAGDRLKSSKKTSTGGEDELSETSSLEDVSRTKTGRT